MSQKAESGAPERQSSWGRKHVMDNPTHRAREGLNDPGSCDDCRERSPIWGLVAVDATPMDARLFDCLTRTWKTPDPMPGLQEHLANAVTGQERGGVGTCPQEGCEGYGRALWSTHHWCPWCGTPAVPHIVTSHGEPACDTCLAGPGQPCQYAPECAGDASAPNGSTGLTSERGEA